MKVPSLKQDGGQAGLPEKTLLGGGEMDKSSVRGRSHVAQSNSRCFTEDGDLREERTLAV